MIDFILLNFLFLLLVFAIGNLWLKWSVSKEVTKAIAKNKKELDDSNARWDEFNKRFNNG